MDALHGEIHMGNQKLGINCKPQIRHIYCKHVGKRFYLIYFCALLKAYEITFEPFPRRVPRVFTRLSKNTSKIDGEQLTWEEGKFGHVR